MWLPSWFRLTKAAAQPAPAARPAPLRLSIESLEERATPSGLGHGHYLDGAPLEYA